MQHFCLARALSSSTQYLIADEMATMLDAVAQAQIWHIMLRLAGQRDLIILAINYEKALLQQISDRIINFNEMVIAKNS